MATTADGRLAIKSILVTQKPSRTDAKVVRFKLDVGALYTTPEKQWTSTTPLVEGEKRPKPLDLARPNRTPGNPSVARTAMQQQPPSFTTRDFPALGETTQTRQPTSAMSWSAAVQGQKQSLKCTTSGKPTILVSNPKKLVLVSLANLSIEDDVEEDYTKDAEETYFVEDDGVCNRFEY